MNQTAEDKVKEYCQCIRREIEHWKDITQHYQISSKDGNFII